MEKWEYELLVESPNSGIERVQNALNTLGSDRWELVSSYMSGAGDNVFVFKRPKR